jgi:hypothetical protein
MIATAVCIVGVFAGLFVAIVCDFLMDAGN